jgi:hypothetical protein
MKREREKERRSEKQRIGEKERELSELMDERETQS